MSTSSPTSEVQDQKTRKLGSAQTTDILPDVYHKCFVYIESSSYSDDFTCVNDVASLTEKGTSRTLASVRANNVLPDGSGQVYSGSYEIYTPEPVGPLSKDAHE
jgi:hypothetical protein